MRRKDDILWKGILEDVFDDFLCFLNPDAPEVFDFNKGFEFLDKELEQVFPPENNEYSPKVIDKLVKFLPNPANKNESWCMWRYRANIKKILPAACTPIFTGYWINIKNP